MEETFWHQLLLMECTTGLETMQYEVRKNEAKAGDQRRMYETERGETRGVTTAELEILREFRRNDDPNYI